MFYVSSSNANQPSDRSGFTLVELLLVMAIIAVLASLSLAVVSDAQNDARRSATQARINQIETLLAQRVEDFQVRRLPSSLGPLTDYVAGGGWADQKNLRRRLLANLLSFELPRNFSQVALNRIGTFSYPGKEFETFITSNNDINDVLVADLRADSPPASDRFMQVGPGGLSDNIADYPDGNDVGLTDPIAIAEAEIRTSSEYLYLILQGTQSNGILAIESLSSRAFADTDEDGFPEVVDSWGNPIGFRFEMFAEDGSVLFNNLMPTASTTPGMTAIPVRNIGIVIFSTGNGETPITNQFN